VYGGASIKQHNECKDYSASQFFLDITSGQIHPISEYCCESLENLTFLDYSFDVCISLDVMEHIFDSEAAFKEIARVLKPGRAHIFTATLIDKTKIFEVWAYVMKEVKLFIATSLSIMIILLRKRARS
jgi:2-polyprenyl-3-methyl-5-hydroxy-6-metoxy-1,4-benzoquinol methylase